MSLDLVLAGGLVVDGSSGAEPCPADVGVKGGLVDVIGDLSTRPRRETRDVGGRIVCPGFIDTHTHIEMASIQRTPDRRAAIVQGVTTTLVGADGFGWVGLDESTRRRWWDDTAAIYGPPPKVLPKWSHPKAFLADLKASSITDVIPLAPHGNIRAAVMGWSPARAGRAELREMRRHIGAWIDGGAVGLASGLDYFPGRFSDTDELSHLCEYVASRGGVYASHLRQLDLGRAGAWEEVAEIGERTGIALRIAHERLDTEGMRLLNLADRSGSGATVDTYLDPAGATSLAFHVPPKLLANGVKQLAQQLAEDPSAAGAVATRLDSFFQSCPETDILMAATSSGAYEGQTLRDLAAANGETPGCVAVRILREELPVALGIYLQADVSGKWDEIAARTLTDPRTMIASDGIYHGASPHPRGFGAFPRVLRRCIRTLGVAGLCRAIHKMTGKPADSYRLVDRGHIRPGLRADMVILNQAEVASPASFSRPREPPAGVDEVFLEGRPVGEHHAG